MSLRIVIPFLLAAMAAVPAAATPKNCPPGLAKKDPACLPPGLAKKGVTAREWQQRRDAGEDPRDLVIVDEYGNVVLRIGDLLPDGEYRIVENPRRYGLSSPGPDWTYYVIRDMIVRADPETRRIVALIGLADALLN